MKPLFKLTLVAGLFAIPLVSSADTDAEIPGYVTGTDVTNVRNNFGECWHISGWTPDMAVVGCDGKVEEPPPPPPPPMVKKMPEPCEEHMSFSSEALFGFDKSKLSAEGEGKLDELVSHLKTYEQVDRVVITGHTDRIGSEAYNMRLSQKRAESVQQYLLDRQAVDSSHVEVEARGESEPVVGCEGVRGRKRLIACLAPNRRVVIDISGIATHCR
jgi:OOP family OmpA-OmpF porin